MKLLPNRCRNVFLCLFLLVFASSCAVVAGGVISGSTVAYLRGVVKTKELQSFDKVWLAAVEAIEQNEFEVNRKESNEGKGLIEAKIPDRDKIAYITIKYYRPEITAVIIRV